MFFGEIEPVEYVYVSLYVYPAGFVFIYIYVCIYGDKHT